MTSLPGARDKIKGAHVTREPSVVSAHTHQLETQHRHGPMHTAGHVTMGIANLSCLIGVLIRVNNE